MTLRELVEDLHGSGLSESEIARRCETSQPTIHRIRHGKTSDTRASLADRIRALHGERKAAGLIQEGVG